MPLDLRAVQGHGMSVAHAATAVGHGAEDLDRRDRVCTRVVPDVRALVIAQRTQGPEAVDTRRLQVEPQQLACRPRTHSTSIAWGCDMAEVRSNHGNVAAPPDTAADRVGLLRG